MSSTRRTVEEIFVEVADLSPEERRRVLDQRCAGDADLRREVLHCLAADERNADRLLEQRAFDGEIDDTPKRIAGYEVVSLIGQGGMGAVYEARQERPRRTVAIKLVRAGMASPAVLRRFAVEAELLGRLRHPGIAHVYEAGIGRVEYGSSAGDRPYLVMELIEGCPLVDHVRAAGLDTAGRLELIARICDAVQHAHQAGVIHRDLKPGNILVDADGGPKVLDFGAARLTSGSIVSAATATRPGQVIGTLQYMSPEQAAGDPAAIDTRSDVYSLGVILYEVLAGEPPIRLSGRPVAEALLAVREGALDRLETRRPDLRGDVATIVHEALETEREDRYASASELASDIRRHLADLPIHARPPTTMYQLRMFTRRNRPLVAGAAAAVLALVAGLVASLALKSQSDAHAELARRNAEEAERRHQDLLRLAAFQQLEDLTNEADELWPPHPESAGRFEAWLTRARALVAGLEPSADGTYRGHRAQLEEVESRWRRRGAIEEEDELVDDRWWVDQLTKLIAALESFDADLLTEGAVTPGRGWSVVDRLAFAEELREAFADGGVHAEAWRAALPAIREAYGGLTLEPQLGLVPIGADPASGLWEFAHLASGAPAERDSTGRLAIDEETGLVLVLVPGGTFAMGAQPDDPDRPNFDLGARPDEGPVREVTLSPFFLSKYEMTQGQWLRLAGHNPSLFAPSGDGMETLTHPVEQVRWGETAELCRRFGLVLPTEARWEYAARAGTTTPWWTGGDRESLRSEWAANLADRTARREGAAWPAIDDWPELDDGFGAHAPVDELAPNPFGFHHVHGNVWEWCLDAYDDGAYSRGAAIDPWVDPATGELRVGRGGSFQQSAYRARSSDRGVNTVEVASFNLGLRPAREIAGGGR